MKKLKPAVAGTLSATAKEALESGKGNKALGAAFGITVNSTFNVLGLDYVGNWFKPEGITDDAWREMPQAEREKVGIRRDWFAFKTNNGQLALSAVMGRSEMYTTEFWKGAETIDDFDVEKIYRPVNRNIETFIEEDYEELLGKTLRCVATTEIVVGTIETKVRAWVVE